MNDQSATRILITGGSGFMGTNAVEYFHKRGSKVVNLDIDRPRNPAQLELWHKCDILDGAAVDREFHDFQPDYLLHLAARTDLLGQNLSAYAANTVGLGHVLTAAQKCERLRRAIFASSRMVCRTGYQPSTDDDYCPPNFYGKSKVIGERLVREASTKYEWILARPTSIWGPWFDIPYKTFFMTIARRVYFHPKGHDPSKSFGYVGNTVYQLEKLFDAPAEYVNRRTLYLCDYPPLNLKEWAQMISHTMGMPSISVMPYRLLAMAAKAGDLFDIIGWHQVPITSFRLSNLVTEMRHDTRILEKVCGELPHNLEAAVASTVEWMRQKGQIRVASESPSYERLLFSGRPEVHQGSVNCSTASKKPERHPSASVGHEKLRVGINAISTIHGGAAVALEKLLTRFVELRPNYEFHVIANTMLLESARVHHPRVKFYFFPWAERGYLRTSLWYVTILPLWLRWLGVDVFFSHTCYLSPLWPRRSAMLLQDARYFSNSDRLSSILTSREHWYFGLKRCWVNYSVRRADEVIVQSEVMAQMVAAKIPQAALRIRVVHHGPGCLDKPERRERRNQESRDKFEIAYISLYRPYKNFSVVFRALRLLEDRGIKARLHLTVDSERSEARRLLRDLAKVCSPGLVVNHGVIDHAAVAELYRAADVAVFSSVCESFGFPQIEAMALGLPVVASDTPINREVCGPVATYFAPDDEEGLASALERLYSRPEDLERASDLSVRRAGKFRWSAAAIETLKLLEDGAMRP